MAKKNSNSKSKNQKFTVEKLSKTKSKSIRSLPKATQSK